MTAVSEIGGRWQHAATTDFAADSPLSVNFMRFAIVNNWLHAYEECGQFRVNWVARVTGDRIALQPSTADTYQLLATFGPFPATIKMDGTAFKWVFRLAGSINDAAETATFKVCLKHHYSVTSDADALDSEEMTTTSTTDAWLTPASNVLSSTTTWFRRNQFQTFDDGTSQEWISSEQYMVRADVYVKCTNAGGGAIPTAYLSGLMLREFIG